MEHLPMSCRRDSLQITYLFISCILIFSLSAPLLAQEKPNDKQDLPEMLLTGQGLIAMNTPAGWERSEGPGLAYFLRKGVKAKSAEAWLYLSSNPIGPNEEDKDVEAFIKSDIAGFQKHFKSGSAVKEQSISLPSGGIKVPVYTFRSGEQDNAFERIAYIAEAERVLIVVLSAKTEPALKRNLPAFIEFVSSYKGSMMLGDPDNTRK